MKECKSCAFAFFHINRTCRGGSNYCCLLRQKPTPILDVQATNGTCLMGKIGRNAPCPCGSGKKYKKCCLKIDEQKSAEKRAEIEAAIEKMQNPEENIPKPSSVQDQSGTKYDGPAVDEEFSDDELDWGLDDDDEYWEDESKSRSRSGLPEISREEKALIDEWYEKYGKLKDPDELKAHLEGFMDKYPHLVDHLELYEEPIFEINDALLRQNRHAEIVALLERIRREYPWTYKQRHGYCDQDLIAYKIAMGKKDEIPPLLDYFRAKPDKDPDHLFPVIDLLKLSNCLNILQDFIPDIYVTVCESSNIIGGDDILITVVSLCFAPFVKPDYTRQDLENLSRKLLGLEYGIDEDFCSLESLEKVFETIYKKVNRWSFDDCRTKEEILKRYSDIGWNFQGYLHSFCAMDWTATEYYRSRIYTYLSDGIPEDKPLEKAFAFSKKKIENKAVKFSRNFFSVNTIGFFGMLNAIFYFADYLYHTQSISQRYHDNIQKWCRELFEYAYPIQSKIDFDAIVFRRFPLEF